MKVTRKYLFELMLKEALRKHFEQNILDVAAMGYEIHAAVDWYKEVTQ